MLLSRIIILLVYIIATNAQSNEIPATYIKNAKNNTLWMNLLKDCKTPSVKCIQKNVYQYFDNTFATKDLTIASFLKLTKNDVAYNTSVDPEDGDLGADEARSSPFSALEEVSEALRDKAYKFMFTHDMEFALPELLGGGVLKIAPRSLEGSGALLKVDIEPSKEQQESKEASSPRIIKKIKKFIGNKLMMAFMAILVVIKLLSVKFMFFLPMIMGVAAAKKLLLKVLLFVIPGLGHLFKLCPYYSPTKYHHHHHQIAHLHKLPHGPNIQSLHGVELDHPPPGWHEHQDDNNFNYYSEGPGVSSDFASHRKNYVEVGNKADENNSIGYGGSGHGQGQLSVGQRGSQQPKPAKNGPLTPTEIENMVLKAEKEAMLKARLQEEQKRVEIENKRLQDQIKNAMKIHDKLKMQSMIAKQNSRIAYQQTPQILQPPPQMQPHIVHAVSAQGHYMQPQGQQSSYLPQVIQPQAPNVYPQPNYQQVTAGQTSSGSQAPLSPIYQTPNKVQPSYDPFYSPILEKIDKVLLELGFSDEPCKERLICSMYKNPTKYSPHSNLVSAELSRDADELQKPISSNQSVIRFYKYVQAARDGQDKRECLRLYPSCTIATE